MFCADCHHVDLLCTITRGYLLARDALCPFRYFCYVLFEHLAVGHSEEELGLYAVCRIIVDVGAVGVLRCYSAILSRKSCCVRMGLCMLSAISGLILCYCFVGSFFDHVDYSSACVFVFFSI